MLEQYWFVDSDIEQLKRVDNDREQLKMVAVIFIQSKMQFKSKISKQTIKTAKHLSY